MGRGEVKNIITGDEVRTKVIQGAKTVYDAVASAYGATSGNVALEKSYGNIVISHDGVSIAKEVILEDKVKDIGADLLIQASSKSNDTSGDGTSGTLLLGYHIMRLANQRISAGYNPMAIRRGIDKASIAIKDELDNLAIKIDDDKLPEVASISSGDPEIGALVADTVVKAGGVGITVQEDEGLGVIQDVIEGLYFEKGWSAPHFVTDQESEEATHQNVHILILEKRITTNPDIVPILELIGKLDTKKVLIIGNISGQALNTCVATHLHPQSPLDIAVVSPPVYGDQVLPFLQDIGAMTGGMVVPESLPADKVTGEYLGFAEKVIVGRVATTILGSKANTDLVAERVETLKNQLKSPNYSSFQKERMEFRLAKLQGKIGIIKVGGATETGRKEMKFRVEDAVHATRSAKESGVVAGGGTTLARLTDIEVPIMDRDEAEGFKAVLEALPELFKQLMTNAGQDDGYHLMKVLESKPNHGFNVKAMTKEPINLFAAGVIDPTKVVKSIVENACEVAGIAITLNGAVTINRQYQLDQLALNRQA